MKQIRITDNPLLLLEVLERNRMMMADLSIFVGGVLCKQFPLRKGIKNVIFSEERPSDALLMEMRDCPLPSYNQIKMVYRGYDEVAGDFHYGFAITAHKEEDELYVSLVHDTDEDTDRFVNFLKYTEFDDFEVCTIDS